MILSWSPVDGALVSVGSRRSAIEALWRGVPEDERTPVRRKLVIALVDHIREHHERTGHLAPEPVPIRHCGCADNPCSCMRSAGSLAKPGTP